MLNRILHPRAKLRIPNVDDNRSTILQTGTGLKPLVDKGLGLLHEKSRWWERLSGRFPYGFLRYVSANAKSAGKVTLMFLASPGTSLGFNPMRSMAPASSVTSGKRCSASRSTP